MKPLAKKDWNKYVSLLSAINKTAGRKMQAWIDMHGTEDVEALVRVAYALATRYGEAAAATACEMYDEMAALQKAHVPAAEPKQPQHINYIDRAVRDTLKKAPGTVPGTVSELVKRTGAETTLKNAIRDGAYFAWVPNGDTCAFCITLASNGWRKASKETLDGDHAEHIHKNCDCEFAISFNGPGSIEGYDPDKYLAMYEGAEGDTWKDKVNSMRRAQYAANKDAINAQKRAAYAERKEREIIANGGGDGIIQLGENQTKLIEELNKEGFAKLFQDDPTTFNLFTPITLKRALELRGFEVRPLGRGKHKGQPFENGGGYIVNFGGNGALEYHPAKGSRHGGRYYRVSDSVNGKRWFDMEGNEIDIAATGKGGKQILKGV